MARGGREEVFTKNLVPGNRTYGEDLIKIEGTEFRAWDPFRSKLAGAILKGLPQGLIGPGDKVLYLGYLHRHDPVPRLRHRRPPRAPHRG